LKQVRGAEEDNAAKGNIFERGEREGL